MKKLAMLILFISFWCVIINNVKAVDLDTRCKGIDGFTAGKFSDARASMCSIYNGSNESRKKEIVNGTYCKYESNGDNKPFSYISIGIDDFKFHMILKVPNNTLYTDLMIGNFEAPQSPLNYFAEGTLADGTLYGVDLASFNLKASTMCPDSIYLASQTNVTKNSVTYNTYYSVDSVSKSGAIAYKRTDVYTDVDYRTDVDESTGGLLDSDGKEIKPSGYVGSTDSDYQFDSDYGYSDMDCSGLLGDPDDANFPAYWLQLALEIIRYAAIIALVGLSTADFVKAIVAQDQDALKKATQTTIKRFIYAVMIFFIPILLELVMNFFGVYGTCSL